MKVRYYGRRIHKTRNDMAVVNLHLKHSKNIQAQDWDKMESISKSSCSKI